MRLLIGLTLCLALSAQTIVVRRKVVSGGGSPTATFRQSATGFGVDALTTLTTDTTLAIAAGDTIVVAVFSGQFDPTSVTCGTNNLTWRGSLSTPAPSPYYGHLFTLESAAAGTTTCTVTWPGTVQYRTIIAAHWTPSVTPTFSAFSCNSAGCDALAATSTSRTAQNITQAAANALHIAIGVDWDGAQTHTAAGSYTLRLDGGASDTAFIYDRVVTSSGTYPSGNFGTVSPGDEYLAFFVVITL